MRPILALAAVPTPPLGGSSGSLGGCCAGQAPSSFSFSPAWSMMNPQPIRRRDLIHFPAPRLAAATVAAAILVPPQPVAAAAAASAVDSATMMNAPSTAQITGEEGIAGTLQPETEPAQPVAPPKRTALEQEPRKETGWWTRMRRDRIHDSDDSDSDSENDDDLYEYDDDVSSLSSAESSRMEEDDGNRPDPPVGDGDGNDDDNSSVSSDDGSTTISYGLR